MRKSSIVKLTSDNKDIDGHDECAKFLEQSVCQLLSSPANLDKDAQNFLLGEVERVFTEEDNNFLLAAPSKEELFKNLCKSTLHASPGSDGLTSYL